MADWRLPLASCRSVRPAPPAASQRPLLRRPLSPSQAVRPPLQALLPQIRRQRDLASALVKVRLEPDRAYTASADAEQLSLQVDQQLTALLP